MVMIHFLPNSLSYIGLNCNEIENTRSHYLLLPIPILHVAGLIFLTVTFESKTYTRYRYVEIMTLFPTQIAPSPQGMLLYTDRLTDSE